MKVKDVIEDLQELDPDEDIIFAHWEHEFFEDFTKEQWEIANSYENKLCFESICYQIEQLVCLYGNDKVTESVSK